MAYGLRPADDTNDDIAEIRGASEGSTGAALLEADTAVAVAPSDTAIAVLSSDKAVVVASSGCGKANAKHGRAAKVSSAFMLMELTVRLGASEIMPGKESRTKRSSVAIA